MSLRPHFIKISDVLVRGIARSTVKREMLRSLRHIAETIDAVMIAEGIEHVEDVLALRDLGLRYGQGYYMARPAPGFPVLRDEVRAELRGLTVNVPPPGRVTSGGNGDGDDDDEDDRDPAIPVATDVGSVFGTGPQQAIPRNAFQREDEITSDFKLPDSNRPRLLISPPPGAGGEVTQPLPPWRPLTDDKDKDRDKDKETEPLLDSLRKAEPSEGERGPGRPGLN
jgi:hypothetical protein